MAAKHPDHLHMVREQDPRPLASDAHKPFPVYCDFCKGYVWVIHTDLPPEDP